MASQVGDYFTAFTFRVGSCNLIRFTRTLPGLEKAVDLDPMLLPLGFLANKVDMERVYALRFVSGCCSRNRRPVQ